MAADHLDETYDYIISVFVERGQAPHVKKWSQFKAGTEAGILALADAMRVMSTPRPRNRLRPDYVSKLPETVPAFVQRLLEVSGNSPFWDLRPE